MVELKKTKAIPTLMHWRAEVLKQVFGSMPDKELLEANLQYYRIHVANNTHLAYIATSEGEDVGCGAICLTDELPSPDNPSGRCAYLMNIYVREPYRCKGIGHAIVKKLLAEAMVRKCGKIYLETTKAGRPVYESLGFVNLPDMMKFNPTYTLLG